MLWAYLGEFLGTQELHCSHQLLPKNCEKLLDSFHPPGIGENGTIGGRSAAAQKLDPKKLTICLVQQLERRVPAVSARR